MPHLEDFKMYTVLAIHCSHLPVATVQSETSYMILINHCDRRTCITHLSDLDISFVL